jgi:hypothetical protein
MNSSSCRLLWQRSSKQNKSVAVAWPLRWIGRRWWRWRTSDLAAAVSQPDARHETCGTMSMCAQLFALLTPRRQAQHTNITNWHRRRPVTDCKEQFILRQVTNARIQYLLHCLLTNWIQSTSLTPRVGKYTFSYYSPYPSSRVQTRPKPSDF